MTKNIDSTRFYSERQEKEVALLINGRVVSNSGAANFCAGDVLTKNFLIECKTKTKESESFTIKKEWITKNILDKMAVGKAFSAIAFNFGPDTPNYFVIDAELFKKLVEVQDNAE